MVYGSGTSVLWNGILHWTISYPLVTCWSPCLGMQKRKSMDLPLQSPSQSSNIKRGPPIFSIYLTIISYHNVKENMGGIHFYFLLSEIVNGGVYNKLSCKLGRLFNCLIILSLLQTWGNKQRYWLLKIEYGRPVWTNITGDVSCAQLHSVDELGWTASFCEGVSRFRRGRRRRLWVRVLAMTDTDTDFIDSVQNQNRLVLCYGLLYNKLYLVIYFTCKTL